MALKIEDYIASVRDFPIEGILFRDITPILESAEAFREVTNHFRNGILHLLCLQGCKALHG